MAWAFLILVLPVPVEPATAAPACTASTPGEDDCVISCLGVNRPIVIGYQIQVTGAGYSGFAADTDKGDYGLFLYATHEGGQWYYFMTGHSINATCLSGSPVGVCHLVIQAPTASEGVTPVDPPGSGNDPAPALSYQCGAALEPSERGK